MPERSKRTNTKHPPQLIVSFPDGGALFDPLWATRVVSFNGVATLELADRTRCKFKPGDTVPAGLIFKPGQTAKQPKAVTSTRRQSRHYSVAHPFGQSPLAKA